MASQIEHTLASLTALSGKYTAQLDGFFKKNDQWFQGVRSTTLASIKDAFRRIESKTLGSRSPVKSLRKKPRRKLKKTTRTRRNKQKTGAPLPAVTDSTHESDIDSGIPPQSSVSQPLQQLTYPRDGPEAASGTLINRAPPPSQSILAKSSRTNDKNHEKRASRSRRVSSKRLTRSTASFQSAIASPILRRPEDEANDSRQHSAHPTQRSLRSPELDESQWQDCRSKPEPVSLWRSKRPAAGKRQGPNNVFDDEEARNVEPISRKGRAPETDSSLESPSLKDINAQSPDEDRGETVRSIPPFSENTHIDHGKPHKINIAEEQTPKNLRFEPEQLTDIPCEDEEEASVLVHRKKRGARPVVNIGSQPAQDNHNLTDGEQCSMELSPVHLGQRAGLEKEEGNHLRQANPPGKSAGTDPSTTEDIRNGSKLATDGTCAEDVKNVDFEFKAPKPRSKITRAKTGNPPSISRSGAHRRSDIPQTPNSQIQRDERSNAPKQSGVFQKYFAVDEGGKINDTGIGLLSEIASTPATASRDNEAGALKNREERIKRGTKLFKPTTDIYSAQRKPALSRVLSVQKSNMSSRASILSHTPGANAPTTRVAKQSVLTGPSSNSLRESLAALKQPITDSKATKPKLDGEAATDATWKGQPHSSLHSDEQEALSVAGGKRLTFADGLKQFESTRTQPSKRLEAQTSPTKGFRQPRIRRDTEKSALRRRIEEIRGKASGSTILTHTSPRSSPDANLQATASSCDPASENSDVKPQDLGTEQERRSSARARIHAVEREVVSNVLTPSKETGNSVISKDPGLRNSGAQKRISMGSHEVKLSSAKEEFANADTACQRSPNGGIVYGMVDRQDQDRAETENERESENSTAQEVKLEGEAGGPKNLVSNLMCSVSSLYPGGLNVLGMRTNEERREETDVEVAAKRQRLDVERREAERLARIEAQRAARQKEAEEKQRRAEARRQLLAEAEKAKEDERKRKEEHRKRVKQQEEEQRKRKKLEEDRKKEERRRQVLEKKAMQDEKRQRHMKGAGGGITGIPKANGLGGKTGKGSAVGRGFGKGASPTLVGSGSKAVETEDGKRGEESGMASYMMTPAKATVIEESDEETERRRHKVVPQWAGERNLAIATRSQPDPDKVFVNMPMCNLRDVFGTQKQYRTRSSSANWTQDRVTTAEMTKYKKAIGGFRDV